MAIRNDTEQAPARRGRRTLLLIALVGLAPVVGSTLIYFYFPRAAATNYGRLLAVPAPEISGTRLDATPFRLSALKGKWLLVFAADGRCGERCRRELYATRQARTIQGREQDRVERVWLIPDASTPPEEVLAQHPGVITVRVDPGMVGRLPAGEAAIYLVDPLGNLVLQYPEDPDIKALSKDLKRVLNASSIG